MSRSAAIYCRISRDDGTALGVTRQEADCRALCERRGWTVADVIVDNDTSAYSGRRRPGYERLLEGIKAGTFTALVIWHPDRLHRRPIELEEFIDIVEASGVDVATVTAGDWDLSTSEGRLMARIVGSVARKESEDKSRRLRRKHLELAQAGKVPGGGRRPFGFEVDKVTVRESEAAEVRSAVARLVAGESLRSIGVDWNSRGVPSVTGVMWSATTIRRLVSSARIAGMREHHGVLSDAVWPAIVPWSDVLRVRARLAARPVPWGQSPRLYLLTGLVCCGRCTMRLVSKPVTRKGVRFGRYACSTDRGGCGNCGIHAGRLDEYVVAALAGRLDSTSVAERVDRLVRPSDDAVAELAVLEARSVELAGMFSAGEITRAEWLVARDGLDGRRSAVEARVNMSSTLVGVSAWLGRGEALRDEWEGWPLGKRRGVVESLVDGLVLAPTTRRGNVFDPSRVSIEWRW